MMGTINRLSDVVRSSIRSGIIIYDLTRVVEELVFNSLDAGATKVSVFISLGTAYLEVVDDGCGITREGLVLLGERYVTSKVPNSSHADAVRDYGFRGEALASISDVSILEIFTRAYGRANGYRKVIKGCRCLHLGIDNDRKDAGTTVVVRDLFYNQPVRRKYMQSCAKKVLHAVKKCVFRIALVNSKVSFKVIDQESEDVLLCTYTSVSPLSLLANAYGSEIYSSLHEFNAADGILKISGYISGPVSCFSVKGLQYVYINSHFVCKGPIHKLLSQMAYRVEFLDPVKADNSFERGKRSRSLSNPSYILNLDCPGSLYDLSFEPSKTYVQFKDWTPILTFIEKAVQKFWMENFPSGEMEDHVLEGDDHASTEFASSENAQKKFKIQNHQASQRTACSSSEMLYYDDDLLLDTMIGEEAIGYLNANSTFKDQRVKGFALRADYLSQSFNEPPSKCRKPVVIKNENRFLMPDDNVLLSEHSDLDDRFTAEEGCTDILEEKNISSAWQTDPLEVGFDTRNRSDMNATSYGFPEFANDVRFCEYNKKNFLKSCSSRGNCLMEGELLADAEEHEFHYDDIEKHQMRAVCSDRIDSPEFWTKKQSSEVCSRTFWESETSHFQPIPRVIKETEIRQGFDVVSTDFVNATTSIDPFSEENNSIVKRRKMFDSSFMTLNPKCCSRASDPLLDFDCDGGDPLAQKSLGHGTVDRVFRKEKEYNFFSDIKMKNTHEENCTLSYINVRETVDPFNDSSHEFCESLLKPPFHSKFSSKYPDMLTDDTDCFYGVSMEEGYMSTCKHEMQADQFRNQGCKEIYADVERPRRSCSAPPFYEYKRRFLSLEHPAGVKARKHSDQNFHDSRPCPVPGGLKHPQTPNGAGYLYLRPGAAENLPVDIRSDPEKASASIEEIEEIHKGEVLQHSQVLYVQDTESSKELFLKETRESTEPWTKWRNHCLPMEVEYHSKLLEEIGKLHDFNSQIDILDISSGYLHLANDLIVPESIKKNCLNNAKVLHQVDKKFIPIVARGTLAIIDQHAADERIRLEELRQKILSGEARTVCHLDTEQELMLPEVGYQLLQNYVERIKEWGWICNINAQDSKSFQRNLKVLHRQETVIRLFAVPCILGVNLSGEDLLEFLQQLSDTDGSSTMPQSVLRVLNSKACRGAIMFGDSLLPSECTLIVEELKKTSLCFQCAHGRPTTVPLVNLEALHKQIDQIGSINENSNELWHGLYRQELSLERTAQRLASARNQ